MPIKKPFGKFCILFKIITKCQLTSIVRFSFLIGPTFTNYITYLQMFTIYIFYRFDINYYCTRVDFFFTPNFFTIFFQTLFEPMFIAVYNVFYTSQPVLALGIFDQDVDATHSLKFPKLYAPGLSSALFNKREFFKSALHGFISSCFLFFISHGEISIAKKFVKLQYMLLTLYNL